MKGSVYVEMIAIIPFFILLFLGVRYIGKGFYLSSYAWSVISGCVRFRGCEWEGDIDDVEVSSVSLFLNEIAGTVGKEIRMNYEEMALSENIKIKALNYITKNPWTSSTKEGWIFGGGLVLLGFIRGFSGTREIKNVGEKIIPDFSEDKLRRLWNGIEERF